LVRVEVANVTPAPRVIHGGPDGMEQYRIGPGETKEIVLPRPLLAFLLKGAAKAAEGQEVRYTDKGPFEGEFESEFAPLRPFVSPPADAAPEPAPEPHGHVKRSPR
jgi:hypothetical protein